MMAAWMAQALVAGLLLAMAARMLDELFRLYRLPRRVVWAVAVTGATLLPLWALLASRSPSPSPVPVPTDAMTVAADVAAVTTTVVAGPGASGRAGMSSRSPWVEATTARLEATTARLEATSARLGDAGAAGIAAVSARAGGATLDVWLASGWLLLSTLLLGLLGWTAGRFARTRRGWREQEIAGTRVFVTRASGPAVVGVFRPAIIVPRWLLCSDAEQQRLVVLHEREHVRSGDHALLAGSAVLAALLPWNVPLQWMLRRLRLAIEFDCDRRVLAAGAEPRAYGAMLIDIASRTHTLPVTAAALADPPTDLERRILAMTTNFPRFRPLRAGAAAACAAALVLVACDLDLMDPGLRDATVGEAMTTAADAAPATAALALNARYFVDGVEVPLDDIRDLPVASFARAEVVRADMSASGDAEVRLMTAAGAAAAAAAAEVARLGVALRDAGDTLEQTAGRVRVALRDAQQPDEQRIVLRGRRDIPVISGDSARRTEARIAGRDLPVISIDSTRTEARVALRGRLGGISIADSARSAEGRIALRVRTTSDSLRNVYTLTRPPLIVLDGVVVSTDSTNIGGVRHVPLREQRDAPAAARAPLIVVDGVITIDARDIESIEIIKGAAAAALYGSRAADGVISITTRKRP
ncbi:hypothetical protein BH23GEM9_BH23GEM9_07510 [soil metagenome]